ncbi:hypothetical protein BWZ22_12800 [Seonamhaeicola sp. S2-3]|uniref:hypothetical protein n=1 Tax=Seonamhaeicola sp. S2-3 TaxID=1936081 RepID=UPI000972BCC5|nr:hypothetical protein [Seonamhaeicola sp. S2-3]APY12053.1 hypothetical protein BWZ22_12800 [Seonamhaeicola sp. S2-3]
MQKSNCFLLFFCLFVFNVTFSQSVEIEGKVISKTDVENIHVINKTAQTFTITNKGGSFKITAKVNDTLQFSSIQQGIKNVVVSKGVIVSKTMLIQLDEQVNELDEVVVGKVLTGDLLSDIENAETDTPINFYDVGIPGYTGKPATQSERRLDEASSFNPSVGFAGSVSILPIINAITGRTKKLKQRVELEAQEDLLRKVKSQIPEDFFINYPLGETLRADFFYFCQEDPNFTNRCKGKSDLEVFQYLKEKLHQYKKNLQSTDD